MTNDIDALKAQNKQLSENVRNRDNIIDNQNHAMTLIQGQLDVCRQELALWDRRMNEERQKWLIAMLLVMVLFSLGK